MFVYKKLKPSDVSITPFEAHKQYIYDSSSAGNNSIAFFTAQWTSESKAHYSENNLAGNFLNHRKYFQLDKAFYRNYITDNGNLIPDVDYIDQERRLYDKVNILSIPQNQFGNRIQPTTFNLTGSFNGGNRVLEIKDDGKGNIYPTNYTLGNTNWPSEKGRVVYIGPVKGFKKTDLKTDNKTGLPLVNFTDNFTLNNVYDDSYYLNQINYSKVNFSGESPLTFIQTGENGTLRLDHSNLYNFGFNQDFNISFFFKTTTNDSLRVSGSAHNDKFYFIAKSDIKTIIPTPGEGTSETLLPSISGNLQPIDVPAEGSFPYRIYYTDDVEDTGSLFFERSNGKLSTFVSTSLFFSGSEDEIIHISVQKTGSLLQIYKNGTKVVEGNDIDPSVCKDFPPTNNANLYIGSRGDIDSYLNSNMSQIMIFDSALSTTQIQNVSQSIVGTPNIGNIFYDEGFITITNPDYKDILQEYSSSTATITLQPTFGTADNFDISSLALKTPIASQSAVHAGITKFNFFNEKVKFWFDNNFIVGTNATTVSGGVVNIGGLNYNVYRPQTSTDLGNVILLPINREVIDYNFLTGSNLDLSNSNVQPFTPSGSHNFIGESSFSEFALVSASRKTFTQSVDILFATNSAVIVNNDFPGSDSNMGDVADFKFNEGVGATTTIGSVGLGNLGGVYFNDSDPGLHLVASQSNTGTRFLGRLSGLLYTTSGVGDIDFNKATYTFTTNNTPPFGVVQGTQFKNAFDSSPNNRIVFLEDFNGSVSSPMVIDIAGQIKVPLNTFTGEGLGGTHDPATLTVELRLNGSVLETFTTSLSSNLPTANDFSFQFISHPGGPTFTNFSTGDFLEVHLKVTGWDTDGSDNGGTNTYNYKVTQFEISAPDPGNVFSNSISISSSIDTKLTSSYQIQLNTIDPNNTQIDNELLGLHQDGNGVDLGVKVLCYKFDPFGTLLTSSFYPSGSNSASNNFDFTHTTGLSEEELRLYVMASVSDENQGSSLIGISQSFSILGEYKVTEISGSNELELSETLSGSFNSSSFDPVIIFGSNSGSIAGDNPVTINSVDGTTVTVADEYIITSASAASGFPVTASLLLSQKISASVNLEIPTSSLLTLENFFLATGSGPVPGVDFTSTLTGNETPRVRIFSASAVRNIVGTNNSLIIKNEHLGYFDSGSTVGIHFDVVDSSNPAISITSSNTSVFSIDEFIVTGITSSATFSVSGSTETFNENLTHIQFSSSMDDSGISSLPFNIGEITSSVTYINDSTVTINGAALFTTESAFTGSQIASSSTGFPIKLNWTFEGGGTGSIYKFNTGSPSLSSLINIVTTDGDTDNNQGFTVFVTNPDGDVISTSNFINSASVKTTPLIIPDFTSSVAGTFLVEIVTTNSESVEIPVEESFNLGLSTIINDLSGASGTKTAIDGDINHSGITPTITELSASEFCVRQLFGGYNTDGGSDQALADQLLNQVDTLEIVSPHTNTGSFSDSPFTTGTKIISGTISQDGFGDAALVILEFLGAYVMRVDEPLFITASTEFTGGIGETQFFINTLSQSADSLPAPISEGNFSFNNNTFNIENIDGNNFIIDEPLLIDSNTDVTLNFHTTASNDYTLKFKNTHIIFEHEYQCTTDEEEYNFTQNVSVRQNKSNQSSDLADCVTGSLENSQITLFKPYVTTVGLYDDEYNLLAVGKFAQPIKMSEETDMTFVIRYDT